MMSAVQPPGDLCVRDVVQGARTVVEAVAYSKRAAKAMDQYIQSLPKEELVKRTSLEMHHLHTPGTFVTVVNPFAAS